MSKLTHFQASAKLHLLKSCRWPRAPQEQTAPPSPPPPTHQALIAHALHSDRGRPQTSRRRFSWSLDCPREFYICPLLFNLFYVYVLRSQLDVRFLRARGSARPADGPRDMLSPLHAFAVGRAARNPGPEHDQAHSHLLTDSSWGFMFSDYVFSNLSSSAGMPFRLCVITPIIKVPATFWIPAGSLWLVCERGVWWERS